MNRDQRVDNTSAPETLDDITQEKPNGVCKKCLCDFEPRWLPSLKRFSSVCPRCALGNMSAFLFGPYDVAEQLPEDGSRVLACWPGVYKWRVCTFWIDGGGSNHFGLPDEPDGKGSQPAMFWHELPEMPEHPGYGGDEG